MTQLNIWINNSFQILLINFWVKYQPSSEYYGSNCGKMGVKKGVSQIRNRKFFCLLTKFSNLWISKHYPSWMHEMDLSSHIWEVPSSNLWLQVVLKTRKVNFTVYCLDQLRLSSCWILFKHRSDFMKFISSNDGKTRIKNL